MATSHDGDVNADLIARVLAYQEVANRYEIDAAVAMFAESGAVEDARGDEYRGPDALRAAHEYDRECGARVAFSDCIVSGDTLTCRFVHCTALDRAVGLDGWRSAAVFTFDGGRIVRFTSLPTGDEERERHRRAKGPLRTWAQRHYPDDFAVSGGFDATAGAALARLARAWTEWQGAADQPAHPSHAFPAREDGIVQ